MTKKILLKWLEEQKVKALAQVDTQENAAKATLLAEKLERTKFAEMVAYVEPRLTEVYDYMMDWHKKNEELAGPLSMSWGTILYSIQNVLLARVPMAEKLQETELREAQVDRDLKKRFSDIRREVEKTYYNVALNVIVVILAFATANRMSCRLMKPLPRTVRNTAHAWQFTRNKMRSSARRGRSSRALRSIWLAMIPGQRNGLRQSPAICATE